MYQSCSTVECLWQLQNHYQTVQGLSIVYYNLLNSQPQIMHFTYSDWFTQSWLSAHIP